MSARNACGKTSSTLPATCSAGPTSADRGDALSSRFAFVLWSGRLGGAETFTAALAAALRRKGDEATVVFVGDADRLGERLDQANVPHVSLGAPRGSGVLT